MAIIASGLSIKLTQRLKLPSLVARCLAADLGSFEVVFRNDLHLRESSFKNSMLMKRSNFSL
jgi:hypothetical protein